MVSAAFLLLYICFVCCSSWVHRCCCSKNTSWHRKWCGFQQFHWVSRSCSWDMQCITPVLVFFLEMCLWSALCLDEVGWWKDWVGGMNNPLSSFANYCKCWGTPEQGNFISRQREVCACVGRENSSCFPLFHLQRKRMLENTPTQNCSFNLKYRNDH